MTAERGVYRYVAPQVAAALGTDTVYTAVALGSFIPPHARRVLMWATAVSETGVGAFQDVYFRPGGTSAEREISLMSGTGVLDALDQRLERRGYCLWGSKGSGGAQSAH